MREPLPDGHDNHVSTQNTTTTIERIEMEQNAASELKL